ncbi:hypothetical protein RhiirA5_497831 [Rhizophagus irregularis]|uniref:Phosphatidylglycerol/phosphatidylinositol transfer protein n=1 Tax=Rhizophagus irregularis TaxID=588596 RepID=A0A2I1EZV8_9GLOM|nr:hypothetical protein RhiirA5_497831 [Rhizophagus irregularis]PKC67717.1 hypothetical protein RhiirA1_534703 [Rhizophagus irregularis]PKC69066.1 hypothetical protein RhiirA1_533704 [Rhizophagus irregularis]PKY27642.1 hypothetical protein RhiirB3_529323 [Rhizophagus irregularis]CAB4488628.1 unnamed protein product [Rhizophagus irregularis]
MNNLFVIFLIFVTLASSTPIRRQDTLSGFKPCKGNFPNEFTTYIYTPNPIIIGQETTVHIAGKATVTIENGALFKVIGFYENKQIFHYDINFCEAIVEPSGFKCPVKDNFDFTTKFSPDSDSSDPKNTIEENDIKIIVTNPDGKDLLCMEGSIKFSYP